MLSSIIYEEVGLHKRQDQSLFTGVQQKVKRQCSQITARKILAK